jgi:phage shock protein B
MIHLLEFCVVLGLFGIFLPLIGVAFIIKAFRGDGAQNTGKAAEDEARIIQEVHQGLLRMEERVDALETLLLEREREPSEKN